ncbi:MAG: VOC family protein [Vicinamibacteria bacterium]|nr:VOC family protein [Vicinamibacteria bacterium]
MDRPAVRFQRANFVVRNLDRALEFYVGVLGLSLDFLKESGAASYSYTVFDIPADARIRFAVLSAPGQPRVMALTEITGITLPPVALPRRAAIVLETPDLDAVAERARARGFLVCPEGELLTFDGRRGRELGLIDSDDNLTVVYALPEAA